MSETNLRKLTGVFFIVGAILVNIPYTLLLGAIMLKRILERENSPFLETATTLGVIGFVVQVIGLLRWVFVVPVLARLFTDPRLIQPRGHPSPLCLLPSTNTAESSSASISVNFSPSRG